MKTSHCQGYFVVVSRILLLTPCICAICARRNFGEASVFTAYQAFAILIPELAYTSLLKQDNG